MRPSLDLAVAKLCTPLRFFSALLFTSVRGSKTYAKDSRSVFAYHSSSLAVVSHQRFRENLR